jgi:hypothetical protein
VDAIGGERDRRHVERLVGERAEPGQPDEQQHPGHELQEAGHPDAPDPGHDVDLPVARRIPDQFLRAVDQIAHPEPEEPERERDERRWSEVDCRCGN